jgi:hypothetical protein
MFTVWEEGACREEVSDVAGIIHISLAVYYFRTTFQHSVHEITSEGVLPSYVLL